MKLPQATMVTHFDHGDMPKGNYYTEAQLKQAIRDALEEAAKVCDVLEERDMGAWACECAHAIRKLKESVK